LAEGITPSRPALTPEQVAGLRVAFAEEVTARLGPLRDAASELSDTGDVSAARVVMAHAHTLASSAVILGEELAALHARRCAQTLQPYLDDGVDPVPADAARAAAAEAATLGVLLGPWLLGTAARAD